MMKTGNELFEMHLDFTKNHRPGEAWSEKYKEHASDLYRVFALADYYSSEESEAVVASIEKEFRESGELPSAFLADRYQDIVLFCAGSQAESEIILQYADHINQLPYEDTMSVGGYRCRDYQNMTMRLAKLTACGYELQFYGCTVNDFLADKMADEKQEYKKTQSIFIGLEDMIAAHLISGDTELRETLTSILERRDVGAAFYENMIRGIVKSGDRQLLKKLAVLADEAGAPAEIIARHMDAGTYEVFLTLASHVFVNQKVAMPYAIRIAKGFFCVEGEEEVQDAAELVYLLLKQRYIRERRIEGDCIVSDMAIRGLDDDETDEELSDDSDIVNDISVGEETDTGALSAEDSDTGVLSGEDSDTGVSTGGDSNTGVPADCDIYIEALDGDNTYPENSAGEDTDTEFLVDNNILTLVLDIRELLLKDIRTAYEKLTEIAENDQLEPKRAAAFILGRIPDNSIRNRLLYIMLEGETMDASLAAGLMDFYLSGWQFALMGNLYTGERKLPPYEIDFSQWNLSHEQAYKHFTIWKNIVAAFQGNERTVSVSFLPLQDEYFNQDQIYTILCLLANGLGDNQLMDELAQEFNERNGLCENKASCVYLLFGKSLSEERRQQLISMLADSDKMVREAAFILLSSLELSASEALLLCDKLSEKSQSLRQMVLSLLEKQKAEGMEACLTKLISAKNVQMRLGGLSLLQMTAAEGKAGMEDLLKVGFTLIEGIKKPTAAEKKLMEELVGLK